MTRRHPLLPAEPSRRRLTRRDQCGAAAVEFALVVGLFIFILYGLIAFGMILATKQRVTNAAAEAARAAVGQPTDADAKAVAESRVDLLLSDSVGKYTRLATPVACGTGTCVKVTIAWDYLHYPVVPPAPGLGLVTPNQIKSEAQVQYK